MSRMLSCHHGLFDHCYQCEADKLAEERDRLKAELEKSHKSFDELEEQFLKLSTLLTEAGMKNKSLYEQFRLWKEEAKDRDFWRRECERLAETIMQIEKMEGTFSTNHFEHAKNTIRDNQNLARQTLATHEAAVKGREK